VEIRNYLRDQAGSRSLVFDLSITHDRYGISGHPLQNGRLTHPQEIDAPLHIAAQRKINSSRQQSEHFFSPRHYEHIHPHARRIFASSFSTGPPGDRGALHCHWRAIATQPIGLFAFQARGILPVAVEQSRTRGGQSGGVTDQPQCRGLWHSSRPSARSFTCSPSSAPPSFTQSPSPPRSPVRDGQTSPHRPRLVVSHSTCPPLSPSPHASNFEIGTAVINTHTRNPQVGLPRGRRPVRERRRRRPGRLR
jgi:hypothetical protein